MIDDSLGYLLNIGSRLIKKDLEIRMIKYNLTSSQWAIIQLLFERNHLSQAEIAAKSSSDRSTIGSVIDKLIEKEYVIKKLSSQDRRSYIVSITEKGLEIVQEIEKMAVKTNRKALLELSQEEVETLKKNLKVIISNLRMEQ